MQKVREEIRAPLREATKVASLNFKTLHFTYLAGSHVPVGILLLSLRLSSSLSQFQSCHLCVVCRHFILSRPCRLSKFTLTGPQNSELLCCIWKYSEHLMVVLAMSNLKKLWLHQSYRMGLEGPHDSYFTSL